MKHHIVATARIVQRIHSITFPPHMLILQKGYYDYDDIFEAAASIFQPDNSSLYVQFYGQLDRTTAADPHRLTSHHLSLHWLRSRHRRFSWPICGTRVAASAPHRQETIFCRQAQWQNPFFKQKRTVPSYCPEIFTLSLELADDILCISKKVLRLWFSAFSGPCCQLKSNLTRYLSFVR